MEEQALTCPEVVYEFIEPGKFLIKSTEENTKAMQMIDFKNFEEFSNVIEKVNQKIENCKNFRIDKREVVKSPSKKIWWMTIGSLLIIVLAFVFEILSVYYVVSDFLAYFGLGIIVVALTVQIFIIIHQMYFYEKSYDSQLQDEKSISELKSLVNSVISQSVISPQITLIYESPFILKVRN